MTGQENATLELHWDLHNNKSEFSSHRLVSTQSLLLERPIKDVLPSAHVWLVSTSPVLVYAVIEICLGAQATADGDAASASASASADPLCYVNAFFVPAVEQYFRCAVEVQDNTCHNVCPSFWNSRTCASQADLAAAAAAAAAASSGNSSSPSSSESSGSNSSSSSTTTISSSGSSAGGVGGVGVDGSGGGGGYDSRVWHVRRTTALLNNGTTSSLNTTDTCVVANASYLPFRLDLASASFMPAGTRLARLYGACLPNVSAQGGGQGDGVDNDCDGLIDEEVEDMADDDGDGRVDEDTSSDCQNDASSRTARSGDDVGGGGQRGAVVGAGPPWFIAYEEEDSQMPLLAVIISLSVAILAVVAVISIFLVMELMSRRRQIRNTKIRPFVS